VNARGAVGRLKDEAGQTFAEFVIVLPLLFMLLFLIITAGIGFSRYLRITDAAQAGARAASVARFNVPPNSTDPCIAAQARAQEAVGGLSIDPPTCSAAGATGDPFTVTVTHHYAVNFPFFTPVTFDITSEATARLQ
jgi:Flp pilus assembly protein TadG